MKTKVTRKKNYNSGRYPVEGTAARKYDPKQALKQRKQTRKRTKEKIRREEMRRRVYMDLPSLTVMFIAIAVSLLICFDYIRLHTTVNFRLENIQEKEAKLENMKAENDELEASLNNIDDLDKIKKIATEELGMVYPEADSVIYFKKTENGYVRQYESIPEN